VAALHEVLVALRVVEAPHHRPHGGDGRADRLDHHGAALVRPRHVGVVPRHRVGERGRHETTRGRGRRRLRLFGAV